MFGKAVRYTGIPHDALCFNSISLTNMRPNRNVYKMFHFLQSPTGKSTSMLQKKTGKTTLFTLVLFVSPDRKLAVEVLHLPGSCLDQPEISQVPHLSWAVGMLMLLPQDEMSHFMTSKKRCCSCSNHNKNNRIHV